MTLLYLMIALFAAALTGLSARIFTTKRLIIYLSVFLVSSFAVATTKIYLAPKYFASSFSESIRKSSPLINLLADNSPLDFNGYINQVSNNIMVDGNPDNIYLYTNNFISAALTKNIPFASNESIYQYLTLYVEMDRKLLKIDPTLVLFIEFPNKFVNQANISNINKSLEPEFLNRLLSAKENIIRSALLNKQPPLNLTQKVTANVLFANIVTDLTHQYGRHVVLSTFENPQLTEDKQKAAEIVVQYYEALLAQGPQNSALIYKSFFSNSK